tara:strand:+ start:1108 stop:1761 length:654 start_codon:yes stop_codon:yes gene_type:complete
MAYFDSHPNLILPSFSPNRNSTKDYYITKNLFRRGKIREDFFQNAVAFEKFLIVGDNRPDNVAEEIYGDPELDWVVLISNNILNVRDEWPMSQYDFQRYLNNKYDPEQLTQIHHYETKDIRDQQNILILEGGLTVDANFTFKYSQDGNNFSLSGSDILDSFTNFDFETKKNDKKRDIFIIRSKYIDMILEDLREIMTYQNSSQFIDRKTKTGDNIRI